jgi:hypothetical protein
MEPVTGIDLQASGPTGYLHTKVKLPEHAVSDLPELLAAAQVLNPAADADALVRTIWRLGCRAVQRNCERHIPIRIADLPYARQRVDDQTASDRQRPTIAVPDGLRRSR